jgi:hypothetical protein
MARDGIAHGKSDDLPCPPDPDPLDANRRGARGFTFLTVVSLMRRVDLWNVERNMAGLGSIE